MALPRRLPLALLAGLTVALAACETGPATSGRTTATDAQSTRSAGAYALGAGDRLRITVFGQTDLSGEFEIDGSGAISMPLIGQVSAVGKTTPDLEQAITTKLAEGYVRDPRVSAEVINYRPFYILGEVTAAGEYPYTSGLSVVNAVASAGGFTYRANKRLVFIKAVDDDGEITYQLNAQVLVQPGDTIRIGERIF